MKRIKDFLINASPFIGVFSFLYFIMIIKHASFLEILIFSIIILCCKAFCSYRHRRFKKKIEERCMF